MPELSTATQELRREIEAGRVVAILGAGITIAATGNASLSWRGLLNSALDYCVDHDLLEGGKAGAEPYRAMLQADDVGSMLTAATGIELRLGQPEGLHWSRWLSNTFRPL